MLNDKGPMQVLCLLEAVGTSLLGFSLPHLADTLDEWQAQAADLIAVQDPEQESGADLEATHVTQVGAGSGRQRFEIKSGGRFNEPIIELMVPLLASSYHLTIARVAPPAQRPTFPRLVLRPRSSRASPHPSCPPAIVFAVRSGSPAGQGNPPLVEQAPPGCPPAEVAQRS